MKREICCRKCALGWRRSMNPREPGTLGTFPDLNEDGEGMRQIEGLALNDCLCDGCGVPLLAGNLVTAVSLYSIDRPYFEWEDEYLLPRPTKTQEAE